VSIAFLLRNQADPLLSKQNQQSAIDMAIKSRKIEIIEVMNGNSTLMSLEEGVLLSNSPKDRINDIDIESIIVPKSVSVDPFSRYKDPQLVLSHLGIGSFEEKSKFNISKETINKVYELSDSYDHKKDSSNTVEKELSTVEPGIIVPKPAVLINSSSISKGKDSLNEISQSMCVEVPSTTKEKSNEENENSNNLITFLLHQQLEIQRQISNQQNLILQVLSQNFSHENTNREVMEKNIEELKNRVQTLEQMLMSK